MNANSVGPTECGGGVRTVGPSRYLRRMKSKPNMLRREKEVGLHLGMNRQLKLALLVGVLVLSVVVFVAWESENETVNSEEPGFNIALLLQRLNNRMKEKPGFLVTLQFAVPPALEEGEHYWTIGSPTDQSKLHISAIGDDYVCLTETSGAATLTRCIPFSNIASISYLED